MNAFREIRSEQTPYAAYVWQGEPHWNHLHQSWNNLIALQNLPCAIYQSPSYFEYLESTEDHKLDLLAICTEAGDPIVGLTPVQELLLDIPFCVGRHPLVTAHVPCLRVLGSEPMVPKTREAHDRLFALITRHFRHLSVVEMDAVSVDGFLWHYLFSSPLIRNNYLVHVLHGIRDCHFVHLPQSIEEYRRRLGRKLRHNLERQQRVLERQLQAPLTLELLNREDQVPLMLQAMQSLEVKGVGITRERLVAATQQGFHYCFILKAGERIIGVAAGAKSKDIYRLHHLCYDKALEKYSPGTTLWHQVLRFLIQDPDFKGIDMGYGAPVYPSRRMNTVYKRGKVLLFRRTFANRCLITALSAFSASVAFIKAKTDFRRGRLAHARTPETGHATGIK